MQSMPRKPTDPEPAADALVAGAVGDESTIARYREFLRVAPPAAIEQAHAEAFRALSDGQRRALLDAIVQALPPREQALATPVNGTPIGLARVITRAETRQPGTLMRLFGSGVHVGQFVGVALLAGIAGAVATSVLAAPWLAHALLPTEPTTDTPDAGVAETAALDGATDPGVDAEPDFGLEHFLDA